MKTMLLKELLEEVELKKIPVVLYGAGEAGRNILYILKELGITVPIYFCDSNADKWNSEVNEVPVYSLDDVKNKLGYNVFFVISVADEIQQKNIFMNLKQEGFVDRVYNSRDFYKGNTVEENRIICKIIHRKSKFADSYYDSAENSLDVFWGKSSLFYEEFQKLDLLDVIELASGHGRHVTQYYDLAGNITLVDILKENIDFCKKRFGNCDKISYYVNNGYDLSELKSNTYTALFTYDAMVHFELMDIYRYLEETYRVLKKRGRGLFHHSNLHSDYKLSYVNSPFGGRNYMSKEIFAYLAYRVGFQIIDQKVFDWGEKDLDCLTLVEK